jgi:FMN phosphatase YigB (HAD superfamily)
VSDHTVVVKQLWPKASKPLGATLALEAVLLDAGGVLILPHVGRLADALSPLGITPPDRATVERAHYLAVQALDIAPDDQLAPGTYVEAFVDALNLPAERAADACAAVQQVWAQPSLYSWRCRVRGTGAGLRRLAATGLKLGVVSNSDGTVERQLRRARICQIGTGRGTSVLVIVDSAVFGVAKPDPSIFQHAVAALGVAPERTLYVGDSLRFDVRGAMTAGLRPVHFDPQRLCPAPDGHPHITALVQLTDLISQSSAGRADDLHT